MFNKGNTADRYAPADFFVIHKENDMNECCKKFPVPSSRFNELADSGARHGTLYQCTFCGSLFEIIDGERSYRSITHKDARSFYSLVGNTKYLNEIDWERIEELHPSLKAILNKEIKKGNKISETSVGWPSKNTLLVILTKPFHDKYDNDETKYRLVNDPHYWKAEYVVSQVEHILACKF